MNTDLFHWHLRRLSLADHRILGEGESFSTWNARILGKAGARVYVALGGAGSKVFSGLSSLLSISYQCHSPVSSSRGCQALEEQGARPGALAHPLSPQSGWQDVGLRGLEGQVYLEVPPSCSTAHQARY